MPTATKTSTEPKFETLVGDLSAADAKARASSADAGIARAERSQVAVSTITAAYSEKLDPNDVRTALLDAGVLKGTVSKIVTILHALNDKVIRTADLKSLNGAYTIVKEIEKIAAGGATSTSSGSTTSAAPITATTPDDALEIILQAVRTAGDDDAIFKAAGDWITRVTNAISDVTRAVGEDEE